MRFPFIAALLALSVIYAEEVFADISNDVEEPIFRIRNPPTTINVIEKNWTSLSDVLDVFSARNLVRNWVEGEYAIGAQCNKDITTYVEALKNNELWALKGTAHLAILFITFYN